MRHLLDLVLTQEGQDQARAWWKRQTAPVRVWLATFAAVLGFGLGIGGTIAAGALTWQMTGSMLAVVIVAVIAAAALIATMVALVSWLDPM